MDNYLNNDDFIPDFKELDEAVILGDLERNVTSPTLEAYDEIKKEEEAPKENNSFSFDQIEEDAQEFDLNDIDEEVVEKEMQESLSKEDYEDFAEIIVEGLDWGIDKGLKTFADRQTPDKDFKNESHKRRIKTLLAKLLVKWGVKFKLEYLLVFLIFSWGYSKWATSKTSEELEKEKVGKKPKKPDPKIKDIKEEKKEEKGRNNKEHKNGLF